MNTLTTPARPWWERVDPAMVEEYVSLVEDTRRVQRIYQATLDPVVRRESLALESRVDVLTGRIRELVGRASPALFVEGGAA